MEIKDYLIAQVKSAHGLLDSAIKDTPAEMVNRKVGEHANTIAAVYAHVIGGEDYFIQGAAQGKARLWESNDWAQKLGITAPLGRDWSIQIPDLDAFRAYAQTVHEATYAYLDTMTPAELDRVVKVFNNERAVSRVMTLIVTHTCGHAGEIATLKGAMGVKGLPF